MPFNVGPWEMVTILLIVLLVFGAKRLPEMGAAMGKGIREFKRNISEVRESIDRPDEPTSARHVDAPTTGRGDPKKLSE